MLDLFDIMPVLFFLIFGLTFAIILVAIVRNLKQWKKNNNSPRLTVDAKVVAKRTNVSHSGSGVDHTYSTSTRYFATFEVESGDRMELQLSGNEYGLIVEGDQGKLTFQGTRFLDFQRQWNS